jgi:chromosome segregation ATPase
LPDRLLEINELDISSKAIVDADLKQCRDKLTHVHQQHELVKNEADVLRSRSGQHMHSLQKLEDGLNQKEYENSHLQARIVALEADIVEAQGDGRKVHQLMENNQELYGVVTSLQAEINHLREDMTNKTAQLKEQATISDMEEQQFQLKMENERLITKQRELKNKLTASNANLQQV